MNRKLVTFSRLDALGLILGIAAVLLIIPWPLWLLGKWMNPLFPFETALFIFFSAVLPAAIAGFSLPLIIWWRHVVRFASGKDSLNQRTTTTE